MRPPAEAIASLSLVVAIIAFLIFVGVEAALVFAAWRYRASRVAGPAPQIHGNTRLEIAWTAIPLVILAVITALMLGTMREIGASVPGQSPADMSITARGYQWWWEFRYPSPDGEVVTANELHIPANTRIELVLESADVVHSFWVPELSGKIDMIPGKTNRLRISAARPGVYRGQCAEFCGVEHAWMRITVVAQTRAEFDRWLDGERRSRAAPSGRAADGERVFVTSLCASCHAVRGAIAAPATVAGPDLTHVGSRRTLGAGVLTNDDASLRAWLADPQRYKPGSFMPRVPVSAADLDALVAYLRSLR